MRKLFTIDHNTNGKGPVHFAWNKGGNLLAVCGASRQLSVLDRQGKHYDQKHLPHPGPCCGLDWDCTGETLAVMQQGSGQIVLWHQNGRKLEMLDTSLKDLTFMKWSKMGPQLAVGTLKGNILLYNKKTLKKMQSMGKHTKRITCGVWSQSNKLALGGDDKVLTISNAEGDTLDQAHMKHEPMQIQFSDMKTAQGRKGGDAESTVSVNMGGKTLLLYSTNDQENPFELAFQQRYGSIVSYKWFGDGYILIGFSSGYVVVISTHLKEIGQEVNSIRVHREHLSDVTYCPALQKGASIGDNCVKVFDMEELQKMSEHRSEKFELENEFGTLMKVEWTDDGQILTISSRNGNLHTFLTRIPVMHDAYETRVLHLTSLRELCVKDVVAEQDIARVPVEIEPSFVSLGPNHAAVGMNNCVWYYSYAAGSRSRYSPLVGQRTYVGSVDYVKLSHEYSAAMCDGRVTLHHIDQQEQQQDQFGAYGDDERRPQRVFPEKDDGSRVTCVAMTPKFLIYGTSSGTVSYFSLEDWNFIGSDYRQYSGLGIRSVYPNPSGTRVVFIDDTNEAYLYNPIDDSATKIERFSPHTDKVLWDTADWGVFVGCDNKHFTTYVYSPTSRFAPECAPVPKVPIPASGDREPRLTDKPFGLKPVLVHNGSMACQMPSGSLATIVLATHHHITQGLRLTTPEQVYHAFYNNLALHRLDEAWKFATQLNQAECWYALGDKALHLLDIDMAIRVYRMVNQPSMVLALDKLRYINEKSLLLGHVAMLFKNFDEAQQHFTRSSCPVLALEMRRDLMHWNAALELSERLAPDQIPQICRENAMQLEFRGDYQQALEMFRRGVVADVSQEPSNSDDVENKRKKIIAHNELCQGGMARVIIRTGDVHRGFQMAMEGSSGMAAECALIFEEQTQWQEAAQLHERAENYDRAAQIYITKTKNLRAAGALMPYMSSHKTQGLFAEAKEKEGLLKEAMEAYTKAEDWDNVVRLKVRLGDIPGAHEIVWKTKSAEAALMVSNHCEKDSPETAIQFLLLGKRNDQAFELASRSNLMGTFAQVIGENGTPEDYHKVAVYYDQKDDGIAGDFYAKCKKYDKALKKYLRAAQKTRAQATPEAKDGVEPPDPEEEYITKAINIVGKSENRDLQKTLIDHLTLSAGDGNPNKYIFRLYMELGRFDKAARMAVINARQQQDAGNYRVAHRMLFEMHKELEKHRITISADLRRNLQILHSYIIVKPLVKPLNDHECAARMLIRVSKNIDKFPKHKVSILSSAVLECNKVGFDKSAYQYAKRLVSEHRQDIAEKHRKKIETIVRKPGYYSKQQPAPESITEKRKKVSEADLLDPPESTSPCPFCGAAVTDTMLDCPRCRAIIPYCIASGRHMVLDDWCNCPSCHFPALHSVYSTLIRHGEPCPMCESEIRNEDVRLVHNPDPRLVLGGMLEAGSAGEGGEGGEGKDESAPRAEAAAAGAQQGGS
eukprot:TRINITY_DN4291_c0_g1_i2.p1 TRINITY_DN4291_c0_g1~~TRINITY_DN4291_c0_g1_i2.p1  ORF type:complete len:1462 (+),score=461.23 TRINITY_DN4291_c0_g1_i2:98-4483(+)